MFKRVAETTTVMPVNAKGFKELSPDVILILSAFALLLPLLFHVQTRQN